MPRKEDWERLKEDYKRHKKEEIKKLFDVDIPLSQDRNYNTDKISKALEFLLDELSEYFFDLAQKN
jgi:hypothetical protein